jgi:capsular polysaccharide biosynthesis protein
LLLGVFTLAGMLGGAGYVSVQVPQYQATTKVAVSGVFNRQAAVTYADIATSPRVLDPVIHRLGLRLTARQVAAEITTDVIQPLNPPVTPQPLTAEIKAVEVPEGEVIAITASDRSVQQATRIANGVAIQLVNVVPRLSAMPDHSDPVKLTRVQVAHIPSSPVTPNPPVALALGLLIGLALGLVAVVLREEWTPSGTQQDAEALPQRHRR